MAVRANVAWTNVDWKNVSWTNVPNSLNHLRFVKSGWLPNSGFIGYVEVGKKDFLRLLDKCYLDKFRLPRVCRSKKKIYMVGLVILSRNNATSWLHILHIASWNLLDFQLS